LPDGKPLIPLSTEADSSLKGFIVDQSQKLDFIAQLTEKRAIEPCPRCQNPQFELLGEGSIPFEEDKETRPFSHLVSRPKSSVIPIIILACNNCGYITYHAIVMLKSTFFGTQVAHTRCE
jgi:hypothetical protein